MANEVKWTEEQKQAIYEKDSNCIFGNTYDFCV